MTGHLAIALSDLDGDGAAELISADNSFLYLFAPYAASFAPLYIETLSFDEITDGNHDPAYQPAFRNALTELEQAAHANKSLWHENGFLAALAATRAHLDEGMKAVAEASEKSKGDLDNFQKLICPNGSPLFSCDYKQAVALPFSAGLTVHLIEKGYLPVTPLQ